MQVLIVRIGLTMISYIPYGLRVSISPSNYDHSTVKFVLNNQFVIQNSLSLLCNEYARKAGNWAIKDIVDGNESNVINMEVEYPDINTIQSKPVVLASMNSTWAETKSYASPNGRREYGFSIYVNTTGTSIDYEIGTMCLGGIVQCGTGASITITNTLPSESMTPITGGNFCVAQFHTHTPYTHCNPTIHWREVGADYENASAYPQLVYDYIGDNDGLIYGGHDPQAPSQIYSKGVRRTIYP